MRAAPNPCRPWKAPAKQGSALRQSFPFLLLLPTVIADKALEPVLGWLKVVPAGSAGGAPYSWVIHYQTAGRARAASLTVILFAINKYLEREEENL